MLRVVKSGEPPLCGPFDQSMEAFQPGMIAQICRLRSSTQHILKFPTAREENRGPFVVIDDVRGVPKVWPSSAVPYMQCMVNEDTTVNGKLTFYYGSSNYLVTDQIGVPIEQYESGAQIYVNREGYLVPYQICVDGEVFHAGRCIGVEEETGRIKFRLNDNKLQVEDVMQMDTGYW